MARTRYASRDMANKSQLKGGHTRMKISPKSCARYTGAVRQSKQVRFRTSSGILRILDVCHRSSGHPFLHSDVAISPRAQTRRRSVCPLSANERHSRRGKQHRYSITSSAVASSVGDTGSPSALAVFRLMDSSNLVGCTIGKSAGFSPLRMRPA